MPSRPATRRCRCRRGGRSLRRARRRSADELDVLDAGARRGLSGAGKRRAAASPREKGRGPVARRIALRAGGRGCFVQTLQARSDGASQARVGGEQANRSGGGRGLPLWSVAFAWSACRACEVAERQWSVTRLRRCWRGFVCSRPPARILSGGDEAKIALRAWRAPHPALGGWIPVLAAVRQVRRLYFMPRGRVAFPTVSLD